MVPTLRSPSAKAVSRALGALAILSAGAAATIVLFPDPLADVFFAGWVLFGVTLALVGGIGAWTNRTPIVWVAALLSTGLSVLGMWSIGLYIAPASLLLLGAAAFSQLAGPRGDVREAIVVDPPAEQEVAMKQRVGAGSMIVGAGLVYAGAFTRELFGACSNETLACAIETTNWGAVGVTVLGLIGIGLGGWLLWKQVYIARVLASARAE